MASRPLLFLTVLTACAGGAAAPVASPANTAPPSTPAADPAAFVLSADGLAGINAGTPPTVAAIQARMPDAEVTPQVSETEGGSVYALVVVRGGQHLFSVVHSETQVVAIRVFSPEVPSDVGVQVGSSYAAAASALGPMVCYGGVEEEGGRVWCRGEAVPWLGLAFELPAAASNDFYGEQVPPAMLAAVLGPLPVAELSWMPADGG